MKKATKPAAAIVNDSPAIDYTLRIEITQEYTQKKTDSKTKEVHYLNVVARPYTLQIDYKEGAKFGHLLNAEINKLFTLVSMDKTANGRQSFFKLSRPIRIAVNLITQGEKFRIQSEAEFKLRNILGKSAQHKFARLICLNIAHPLGLTYTPAEIDISQIQETKQGDKFAQEITLKPEFFALIKGDSKEFFELAEAHKN